MQKPLDPLKGFFVVPSCQVNLAHPMYSCTSAFDGMHGVTKGCASPPQLLGLSQNGYGESLDPWAVGPFLFLWIFTKEADLLGGGRPTNARLSVSLCHGAR